jgi:hypothetical protein
MDPHSAVRFFIVSMLLMIVAVPMLEQGRKGERPQVHIGPIGVRAQQEPKPPPFQRPR